MARVIVKIRPSSSGANSLTRYMAESKLDPKKEHLREREPRPLFSRELDGLTYQQADELLAQGEGWFPDSEEVIHLVIAPEGGSVESLGDTHEERKDAFRDRVRDAAEVIEKEVGVDELRWVGVIHFNTDNPHAHIAISRYGIDRETMELVHIDHLPESLLTRNKKTVDGEKVSKPGLIAETVGKGIDIQIARHQEQQQVKETEPAREASSDRILTEETAAPSTTAIDAAKDTQQTTIDSALVVDPTPPETAPVIDSDTQDTFFGLDAVEPETDFSFETFEPDLDHSDKRIQDRETIGRSMVARAEAEKLDAELNSLIEHGDKRRFRVLDASHGRTRQISEFDIKRRADTRAAVIVKDKEIVDPAKRHLARQVQYETEIHAHDHAIRSHQIILNKSIKKVARDLDRATEQHAGLKAEVRAIQAHYRSQGERMPTPILSFHDLGKLQDQALSNVELQRFQTLENIRVELAAEFGRPTRTDKEVARLEGQLLSSRVEQAARHERHFQFERHKQQTRFEIGNEKYSLAELDRQIAEKESASRIFPGKSVKIMPRLSFKLINLLPSHRHAAAAEADRLREMRTTLVEKMGERSVELQSSLQQSIDVTETLTNILGREQKEQGNRNGKRLDKVLTRSELSYMVDAANTLSDPAMLHQAYLLEAQQQDRRDGKTISVVEQAARALGRAVISAMSLRHAKERLQAFEERRGFVSVIVKDLQGNEVTTRLSDFHEPRHPIKWLAHWLAESKEHRHLKKETTKAVAAEHDLLRTEAVNAKQCDNLTQTIADNYHDHLTTTNQPIPEPVFTTKQIIQLEIQAIREPEQHERDRIMSLINHAEESKHVFTPQALDTKNLAPDINPMDVNEQLDQHLQSHLKEPSSFAIVTGQHVSPASSTEQATASLHHETTALDAGPDIEATL